MLTSAPLDTRNWTVQRWPALEAFTRRVRPPSDSRSSWRDEDEGGEVGWRRGRRREELTWALYCRSRSATSMLPFSQA